MRAHHLASLLLAGPDHEVSIGFDEQTCEEYPEGVLEDDATPTGEVRTIDAADIFAIQVH